jgi:hypothetical protein
MNGQEPLFVDRGRWIYRLNLDSSTISVSRAERAGQYLAEPEVWRVVADLGLSDVLIVAVPGGWQAFVEVANGRRRWALAVRATAEEAEQDASHLLASLADAVLSSPRGSALPPGAAEASPPTVLPRVPEAVAESAAVASALARAVAERDAAGWVTIYNRQRSSR